MCLHCSVLPQTWAVAVVSSVTGTERGACVFVSRASSGRAPRWQGPGAGGGSVASSSPLPASCTSRTQVWVPSAVRAAVPSRKAVALGDCVD